jgi:hypothetical protein
VKLKEPEAVNQMKEAADKNSLDEWEEPKGDAGPATCHWRSTAIGPHEHATLAPPSDGLHLRLSFPFLALCWCLS